MDIHQKPDVSVPDGNPPGELLTEDLVIGDKSAVGESYGREQRDRQQVGNCVEQRKRQDLEELRQSQVVTKKLKGCSQRKHEDQQDQRKAKRLDNRPAYVAVQYR